MKTLSWVLGFRNNVYYLLPFVNFSPYLAHTHSLCYCDFQGVFPLPSASLTPARHFNLHFFAANTVPAKAQ